uniref:Myosin heavy chain n=1 Tax=Macrostomum lignano TaxID=282301 RepID=A0A1I8JGL6_9PLAT
MTSTADSTECCSSKFCGQTAAGVGRLTCLPFCEKHLQVDMKRLEKRKTDLLERLKTVISESERRSLRLEQQALATELQEVAYVFDAAQERLQQWRDRLMSRVQEVHDAVAERLQDASQAEECAKEVKDENSQVEDCGKLFASVESWLDEACSRSEKFSQQRVELRNRQSRQLDDQAAAGVEQLQFEIDRHLTGVMRQCWLDDREASPVLRPSGSISDLPSSPRTWRCAATLGASQPTRRVA